MTYVDTPDALTLWGSLSASERWHISSAARVELSSNGQSMHPTSAGALDVSWRSLERLNLAEWSGPLSRWVLTDLGRHVAEPPLVFLDQDGVVARVIDRPQLPGESDEEWRGRQATADERLDRPAVLRLNRIATETGARFVSSSTWRYGQKPADAARTIEAWMRGKGFTGKIIGATPILGSGRRGQEIQHWLDMQPTPARAFAILDDWEPMGDLEHRTVYTNHDVLLTDRDVDRVIALLSPPARRGRTRRRAATSPTGATT